MFSSVKIENIVANDASTLRYGQKTLNVFGKIHYAIIIIRAYWKIITFYRKAIRDKECYYGPFKGEFGHFLLHNLPFLVHLYKKGVKIHYCGVEIHKPLMINEKKEPIFYEFYPLRDFFAEVTPNSNDTIPPADVQHEIDKFKSIAINSKKAFLDISDVNLYWYVFKNWQLKGKQGIISFKQFYGTDKNNSCVIFPRKKGGAASLNNGRVWDYERLAKIASNYFDMVYIVGHPSMSSELKSFDNVEVCISSDNNIVMEKCCKADLIITQHSGAVHMGAYAGTQVLLIFMGNLPIRGIADTFRFRKNLTNKPIDFAFSFDEIEEYLKNKVYVR